MGRTLLFLHAHPDDEASKGAATAARYADAGVRCVLVTATGGEAGDVLNPAMDRPDVRARLAELRAEELAESAEIIGFSRTVLLGYRDSGMAGSEYNRHPDAFVNVPFDRVVGDVVRIIREERPQVVVGYDEHVRYPHPDHIRIHQAGIAAFAAAADPDRYPEAGPAWAPSKLYAPVFTAARLRALHEAMLDAGRDSPFTEAMERLGDAEDPQSMARVRVSATLGRARRALLAHRTQIDPTGRWFSIPLRMVRSAYPWEDFELLGSRIPVDPPERDLFAGIRD